MAIQNAKTIPESNPESFPPKAPEQSNIYKPSDIKRWGTERFLAQVASQRTGAT